MAKTVQFGTVQKRVNSTFSQIPMTSRLNFSCVFKEGCDYRNPTIIVDTTSSLYLYNVMQIDSIYYDVTSCKSVAHNRWEVSGKPRPQATLSNEIKNTYAFIEYGTADIDPWIADPRLTMTNDIITTKNSVEIFGNTAGTVILGVAGYDAVACVGFTSYYAVTDSARGTLQAMLYNVDSEFWTEVKKMFADPYEAIISAHWVPFVVSGTSSTIKLGNNNSGVSATGLLTEMYKSSTTYSLDIPWHYEDWRDMAPYANLSLYLPMYGEVTLDQNKLKGVESLTIDCIKDALSGEICYHVSGGTFKADFKCSCVVPLSVGQNATHMISGLAQAAGGATTLGVAVGGAIATGGASLATAAAAIGGIVGIAKGEATAFSNSISGRGGQGGFATGNMVIKSAIGSEVRKAILTLNNHTFTDSTDNLKPLQGVPIFRYGKIGDYQGGYVKCSGASVQATSLTNADDVERVNSMLNGCGMYIE